MMKKINISTIGKTLSRNDMKKIMAGSGSTNCVLCYGATHEQPRFFSYTYQGQDPNLLCRSRGPYPYGTWGTC